ncbi:MAG: glycosyltransferase family 2 protein [Deltaproteobacteria bacterium]|nr:glycosyltransferase family 2 protein [Deltaproteobacteria bacterium]
MKLSILLPIHNEEENISALYERLTATLEGLSLPFEIIMVNDGSQDRSEEILDELGQKDARLKVIHFRRNYGQTAAIMAGIDHCSGEVIIPMDGDNQNDPADIPRLLDKIREGYDVVSGWRQHRKDGRFLRILPSRIANWIISWISGVRLHDYGCTMKAYRRDVIKDVRLYGEMHRFIPIYASWQGAGVIEIPVTHHPRRFGRSHYGISRTSRVVLDLLLIRFLDKYSRNPIHLFGGFGLFSFLLGLLCAALMLYYKFWGGKTFVETPLPVLSVFFFMIGFMAILIGFIAEILMRTYYESQRKPPYTIKKTVTQPGD